jgi:hypothetical protein
MNAFYYGINLGWIAGIFLALFIVGGIWQHQCVQSTEVSKPFKCWKHLYLELTGRRGGTGWDTPILIMTVSMDDLEAGKHWHTECKLMEVNIRDGAFSEPVNNWIAPGLSSMYLPKNIIVISLSGNCIRLKINEIR